MSPGKRRSARALAVGEDRHRGRRGRKFSPEFMNRLDNVIDCRSLTDEALRQIIELELAMVQRASVHRE